MTVFTSSCKDPLTNMEIIAKDLSFNMACNLLETKMKGIGYLGCEAIGEFTKKLKFATRDFYYDEKRKVLLGH